MDVIVFGKYFDNIYEFEIQLIVVDIDREMIGTKIFADKNEYFMCKSHDDKTVLCHEAVEKIVKKVKDLLDGMNTY